jgi:hypothetical protein
MTFDLMSSAFTEGELIPVVHTCDGANQSPPLEWGEPPAGTRSLALILDDPDAPSGTFTHWVLYGLPARARGLPQGVSTDERPSQGGVNGKNTAGRLGYIGPCPPAGPAHRYIFRLYALDVELQESPGLSKEQLLRSMEGHVIGEAELTGVYRRQ